MREIDVSRLIEKLRRDMESVVEPVDWALVLLYAFSGRAPSKLHVQKALFVASRYIDDLREALEFKAYRMGPWSEEVEDALEIAALRGMVVTSRDGVVLTERGRAVAELVWQRLSDRDREVLGKTASFLGSMSEDELLLYIYIVYGYSEKSDIINRLLRRRKELAVSMLGKDLISVELAARIAGMTLKDFISYLREKGVKPYVAEANDIEEAEKL